MEKEIKDGAKVFVLSTWKNEEMEETYRAIDMVVEVGPGKVSKVIKSSFLETLVTNV